MTSLEPWVQDYALTLAAQGTPVSTSRPYLRSIHQFLAYLADRHPDVVEPGHITRTHFQEWLAHLSEQGKAPSTRRVRHIAVGLWFKWLMGEKESGLTINPAMGVKKAVVKEQPVRFISDEEVAELLKTCEDRATFVDRRDTAIFRLLFDCGLRRIEITRLDVDHVDMRAQGLLVQGKGDKRRAVPFGSKTALALSRYLRQRSRQPAAEAAALFLPVRPSTRGEPWRLRPGAITEMVGRRAKAAGLRHLHPHLFRHLAAHDLLANGALETEVEYLFGWSSPLMVRRYTEALRAERAQDKARRLRRGDRL